MIICASCGEQVHPDGNKWISVEDELPDKDITVLAVTSNGEIYTMRKAVIVQKNARPTGPTYEIERITHWQPLPKAPES